MNSQEKKIVIAFGFVAILLLIFVVIFLTNLIKQQRRYRILEAKKLDSEIEASEAERFQIATELHNDIGPHLSGIKMRLQLMETSQHVLLHETLEALDQTIQQLRTISNRLAPLSILKYHWVDAIRQYIHTYHPTDTLVVDLLELQRIELSDDKQLSVFRILQEVILNTIKHANATVLKIEVSQKDSNLLIRTSDNGVGFDAEKQLPNRGLGLLSIESRVQHLHGTLSLSTAPGKGTKYNIRIPLS